MFKKWNRKDDEVEMLTALSEALAKETALDPSKRALQEK